MRQTSDVMFINPDEWTNKQTSPGEGPNQLLCSQTLRVTKRDGLHSEIARCLSQVVFVYEMLALFLLLIFQLRRDCCFPNRWETLAESSVQCR